MTNSFLPQIAMIALSVGIIFFHVQPTFAEIGTIQDAIITYKSERQKVDDVNQKLSNLVSQVNDISTADQRALLTYMPDTVDQVSVSRDIYNMAESVDAYLKSVRYEGETNTSKKGKDTTKVKDKEKELSDTPIPHTFSLSLDGTYDQIKSFLSLLEQNNYPLEVHELKIISSSSRVLSAEMKVVTYSHLKNI